MDLFAGRTYWWKGIPITITCLLVSRKKIGKKHKLMQKGIRKHRELIDHILHTAINHFVVKIKQWKEQESLHRWYLSPVLCCSCRLVEAMQG
jgi:hypothetical protein